MSPIAHKRSCRHGHRTPPPAHSGGRLLRVRAAVQAQLVAQVAQRSYTGHRHHMHSDLIRPIRSPPPTNPPLRPILGLYGAAQRPTQRIRPHLRRRHDAARSAVLGMERPVVAHRSPTGECAVKSEWVKVDRLHPLVPRTTDRFKKPYHRGGAVEREFGG